MRALFARAGTMKTHVQVVFQSVLDKVLGFKESTIFIGTWNKVLLLQHHPGLHRRKHALETYRPVKQTLH